MKIKKPRYTNKNLVITALAVILLALTISALIFFIPKNPNQNTVTPTEDSPTTQPINMEPPTEDEQTAGNSIKEESVDDKTDKNNTVVLETPFYDTTSGILQVRTHISKPLSPEASCKLALTSGSSSRTEAAVGIQQLAGYWTCKGWNVPSLESGTWKIEVVITDGQNDYSANSEVTI